MRRSILSVRRLLVIVGLAQTFLFSQSLAAEDLSLFQRYFGTIDYSVTGTGKLRGSGKKDQVTGEYLTSKPITIDFVNEALRDLLALQDRLVTIENIQKTVAEYYKVKPWSIEHKLLLKKHLRLYADAGGKFVTTLTIEGHRFTACENRKQVPLYKMTSVLQGGDFCVLENVTKLRDGIYLSTINGTPLNFISREA